MPKVYWYNFYWQVWNEIIGYDEETGEIISKRITPLNDDAELDKQVGQIKRNPYTKLEMKFCSLEVVEREGKKYDEFCKEAFKTCREAYRILHFQMNIPNKKFDKEGCIERR